MLMVVNEEVAPPQFSEGFTVVPPWAFLTPEYPSSPNHLFFIFLLLFYLEREKIYSRGRCDDFVDIFLDLLCS